MKGAHLAVLAALLLPLAALGQTPRPVVIESYFTLPTPPPLYSGDFLFTGLGDIDDDIALIGGLAHDGVEAHHLALLYRHAGNAWVFDRVLEDVLSDDSRASEASLRLEGNVAVINDNELRIYEYNGTQWTRATVAEPDVLAPIAIDHGRVLASFDGTCEWDGNVYEKSGATWIVTQRLDGKPIGCSPGARYGQGSDRAISGDLAVIDDMWGEEQDEGEVLVYRLLPGTNWRKEAILKNTEFPMYFFMGTAIQGQNVLVGGPASSGTFVMAKGDAGWALAGHIAATDNFEAYSSEAGEVSGELVLSDVYAFDRGGYTARLFRHSSGPDYEYVAQLAGPNGGQIYGRAIDGQHVLAQIPGTNAMVVYELPQSFTTDPTLQDDFETGNGASWTALPGSQWSVRPYGPTHVYNQASTAGDAGAILAGSDRKDQSIQAEILGRAFNGPDRWFGLVTRYTDDSNYYYVTLRSSNRVDLKVIANGVYKTLASAPLTVAIGHKFRVSLESVGTTHRVYVDGKQLLVAYDSALSQGSAGIRMYRASADYDNVIVSSGPRTTIMANTHPTWAYSREGGSWSDATRQPNSISQSLTDGDARMLGGSPDTTDQVVQARLWLDAFATPVPGKEYWYGLFARYVDPRNNYYVTLRSSNQLQIRKVVDGVITVLASTPFTVNSTPHLVRFDVIGDRLRVFVDSTPVLEARDASIAAGKPGVGGYKTAATFGDIVSYQP